MFRAIAIGLVASIAATLAYARLIAPRWLEVVRLRVALPGLPREWDGVRIAHLSDFHTGGAIPVSFLQRAKKIALEECPDLIALTGDYFDEGRFCESENLFVDWPDGVPVVAVLGNHDHRATEEDMQRLLATFQAAGIELLVNRALPVLVRAVPAWVVGVDDPYSLKMDEGAAFGSMPASADVLLYLAHSPVAVRTMPIGRVRLMLAGHTHGGQIRITRDGRIPIVTLARKVRGNQPRPDPDLHRKWHWRRGAVLVISNGLGVSKLPLRFRTRPQVILIELARTTNSGSACDDVSRYVRRLNPERWWSRLLS